MLLSEFKSILIELEEVKFRLTNGTDVPPHFHLTEVGQIQKRFIDCGGTIRSDDKISFQLYTADDIDHRLNPSKTLSIIKRSEEVLNLSNKMIEVEYQSNTIGKYGLEFDGKSFLLTSLETDCLAKEKCGIPNVKQKVSMSSLGKVNDCKPGSGCC